MCDICHIFNNLQYNNNNNDNNNNNSNVCLRYDFNRINRIYTKCDNRTIGDEYHYIMECQHFSNFRNRFIITNLRERRNILKFKQIMSAS